MRVEFLWFQDCPNHDEARRLVREVLRENGLPEDFQDIDATNPATAEELDSQVARASASTASTWSRDLRSQTSTCRAVASTGLQEEGCRVHRRVSGSRRPSGGQWVRGLRERGRSDNSAPLRQWATSGRVPPGRSATLPLLCSSLPSDAPTFLLYGTGGPDDPHSDQPGHRHRLRRPAGQPGLEGTADLLRALLRGVLGRLDQQPDP